VARKRLLSQLYPYFIVMLVLSLAAATWYSSRVAQRLYLESTEESLLARARLVEIALSDASPDPGAVDSLCKSLGETAKTRFTYILPSGKVIGDSNADPRSMANHADRPEIARDAAKNEQPVIKDLVLSPEVVENGLGYFSPAKIQFSFDMLYRYADLPKNVSPKQTYTEKFLPVVRP